MIKNEINLTVTELVITVLLAILSLQRFVSFGHFLLELLEGSLPVEVFHPLSRAALFVQLPKGNALLGFRLARRRIVTGGVFVEAGPIFISCRPADRSGFLVGIGHCSQPVEYISRFDENCKGF